VIAPQMQVTHPKRFNLPDSEFQREIRELDGTPEELFEDPAILDLFLPTLRADVTALVHYAGRRQRHISKPLETGYPHRYRVFV
jgi:medium-chain acyl-[acyl-carrier-protein] hydrolase